MPLTKREHPTFLAFQNALRPWILATRPKTLIAGVCPVVIGIALVLRHQSPSLRISLLCLFFSIVLQVGTNWANDYFDFCKGADTPARKGPPRAVLSGWITPHRMKRAAFAAFSTAALLSLPLLARIGFSFTPLMLLSLICGVFYTGGKKALGYLGLGECLVLFFYGPIATCGTVLAHLLFIPKDAWIASLAPGFLACALLVINNLRDVNEDRQANKRTLAVRFGTRFARWEYSFCLVGAAVVPLVLVFYGHPLLLLSLWALAPLSIKPLSLVLNKEEEPTYSHNLNRALGLTARLQLFYTVLFYALLSL